MFRIAGKAVPAFSGILLPPPGLCSSLNGRAMTFDPRSSRTSPGWTTFEKLRKADRAPGYSRRWDPGFRLLALARGSSHSGTCDARNSSGLMSSNAIFARPALETELSSVFRGQNLLEPCDERGKVPGHDLPEDVVIDPIIPVDEPIPHSHDLGPREWDDGRFPLSVLYRPPLPRFRAIGRAPGSTSDPSRGRSAPCRGIRQRLPAYNPAYGAGGLRYPACSNCTSASSFTLSR